MKPQEIDPRDRFVSINAPHFCARLVATDGIVRVAAPNIAYMRGWPLAQVFAYCDHKNWKYIDHLSEKLAHEIKPRTPRHSRGRQ